MEKDFESIKSKVLKLQALAERGEEGEARNAKRLLDQMLAKYGVTLEDIVGAQDEVSGYIFNVKENGFGLTLFFQCYFKVTGDKQMRYRKHRRYISVELTKLQYVELKSLYDWHYKQLSNEIKRMQKDFSEAYIQKHKIFRKREDEGDSDDKELTREDIERLLRILKYMDSVEDTSYYKQIGNGSFT